MFKISFFIKKMDDISAEDFRQYWLEEHARLQMAYVEQIGVRQYIKCEVLPDHPLTIAGMKNYQTGPIRYDFVDHWIFNDIEDLRQGAANTTVQELMQEAYASENDWIDLSNSNVHMSTDLVQFFPADANEVRATEGSPYLKIYYHVRILPHLTRQQAQLHWNACHGCESRQHIRYSQQKKYLQSHAIDSTFVDNLVSNRGYEVDSTIIGHAEGWVGLNPLPNDFSEEEEARIASMTMDDIDLFSDKKRGSVFFATEHYILNDTVVTRPDRKHNDRSMPAFFSAVY
ncbi:EthD domain-containing protein [Pseudomonadales bacterium]|nr:EthD domain-containing protein [Pseudomonadales bacterium]MDC1017668.1 EthD domain-containing protein [Pseudomonadales bacterium]